MTWQVVLDIGTNQYLLTDENGVIFTDEEGNRFVVPGSFVEEDTERTELPGN